MVSSLYHLTLPTAKAGGFSFSLTPNKVWTSLPSLGVCHAPRPLEPQEPTGSPEGPEFLCTPEILRTERFVCATAYLYCHCALDFRPTSSIAPHSSPCLKPGAFWGASVSQEPEGLLLRGILPGAVKQNPRAAQEFHAHRHVCPLYIGYRHIGGGQVWGSACQKAPRTVGAGSLVFSGSVKPGVTP